MTVLDLFQVLQTEGSEVNERNLFKSRHTMHVPDFFVAFFSLSIFCGSIFSDMCILYKLYGNERIILLIVFAASSFSRVLVEIFLGKAEPVKCLPPRLRKVDPQKILYLLGLGSFNICIKILSESYSKKRPVVEPSFCLSFPIFHTSRENVYFIKIYCFVYLVLKSIPQLLILPVIIMETNTRIPAMASILINIVLFSQTMALTIPLRKTSKIFRSCTWVLFNGISKFLATTCACCINLMVFSIIFQKLRYYAMSLHLMNFVVWMWPCWRSLQSQKVPRAYFVFYWIVITVVFSFIYIHPFKGRGQLYYYSFYLYHFLSELAFIYLGSDANFQRLSYYLTLKILMFGFLSCFGLLNKEKYECIHHHRSHDSITLEKETRENMLTAEM